MTAIAGLWHQDGRHVERRQFGGMLHALRHRGAFEQTWVDGPIAVGYRARRADAPFPICGKRKLRVIAADIRFDARAELTSLLEKDGNPRCGDSDAALLMAAWETWESDTFDHLVADFALAVWDAERQRLYCGRDPMGVKPLYYATIPGKCFAFASEAKALRTLPWVSSRVDDDATARLLIGLGPVASQSYYLDIKRLAPGHFLEVGSQGQMRQVAYWRLEAFVQGRQTHDLVEKLENVFVSAVQSRLRDVSNVAVFLSGGLDSASVAAVASRLLQGKSSLHSISTVFPDVPDCDERAYIEQMVDCANAVAHFIRGDDSDPLKEWQQICTHFDEPIAGPNTFIAWNMYRLAGHLGVDVVLDGYDGNYALGDGLARLYDLASGGDWRTFRREAELAGRNYRTSSAALLRYYGYAALQRMARNGQWFRFARSAWDLRKEFTNQSRAKLLKLFWRGATRRSPSDAAPRLAMQIFNRSFARRIDIRAMIADAVAESRPCTEREEHCRGLRFPVHALYLEQMDKCGIAHGVDTRHPYFDRRLLELCVALPADLKLRDGLTRWGMRQAMAGRLPDNVRLRGEKSDLSANFRRAFLQFSRPQIERLMGSSCSPVDELVDRRALQQVYNQAVQKPGSEDIYTLWRVLVLDLWMRHQSGAEEVPKG